MFETNEEVINMNLSTWKSCGFVIVESLSMRLCSLVAAVVLNFRILFIYLFIFLYLFVMEVHDTRCCAISWMM